MISKLSLLFLKPCLLVSGVFYLGLIVAPVAFAQVKEEAPVSLSYTQLTKCFPELANESWTRKVDLNQLKEEIDRRFLTTSSLVRHREILLKDPAGITKRLRLAAKANPGKKPAFTHAFTVEKLDDKGTGTAVQIPVAHQVSPSEKVLGTYISNQEVLRDETSTFDAKLKGVTAETKRNFKDVQEIELNDPKHARRLACENKKDLGIVCSCFKK